MSYWTFADVWEAVAEEQPNAPAQMQLGRTVTWNQFDKRANGLAADLLEAGITHQSKVVLFLRNCPEYLETCFACFKAGFVPVNANYRYLKGEMAYLFDDSDAEAVVFHSHLAPVLEEIRGDFPQIKRWYVVSDGTPEPTWPSQYETAAAETDRIVPKWGRSGDDILLLYTGGTTGWPKGVMWRQHDLFMAIGAGGTPSLRIPSAKNLDELRSRLTSPGPRLLSAQPLMHGGGFLGSLQVMWMAGCIVSLSIGPRVLPDELWRTVDEKSVNVIIIVGDVLGKRILEELDQNRDAYDLSSLLLIVSGGAMWSADVKRRLIAHLPGVTLLDSYGSTEGIDQAVSITTRDKEVETAKFYVSATTNVFTEDGRPVTPGSDEIGIVAKAGPMPLGYYKDDEKSASIFRTIDRTRYLFSGDYARVNSDGTIQLLGRGSEVINTGGEKVFAEEVEEVVKAHPLVRDAACVGVPHEYYGETVAVVIEAREGAAPDPKDVIQWVQDRLAHYKRPSYVIQVEQIERSAAGKLDRTKLRQLARQRLGLSVS